ncbi:putative glutathione S-transferase [Xylaria grammica]|nr:putative glutathione S-transferase [Xylaria grammica]
MGCILKLRDPFLSPQSITNPNPLCQAPVIQNGDVRPPESGAIVEYNSPSIYQSHFTNRNLHPQLNRVMVLMLYNVKAEKWHSQSHFKHLETFLKFIDKHPSTNEWLAGSTFTAADIMDAFPLTRMRTLSALDLSGTRSRAQVDPDLELMIDGKPPAQFLQKLKDEAKM